MKARSRPDAFDTISTGTGPLDPNGLWSVLRPLMSRPLKRRHALLLTALLVAADPSDLKASDTALEQSCIAARKAVPSLSGCVATPNGLVLANTKQEATTLAEYAVAGEERFRRHFSAAPPAYAVLTSTSSSEVRALRSTGLSVVLPWKPAAEMQGLLLQSLRQSAETSARAQGLSAAQATTVAEQAVSGSQAGIIAAWGMTQRGLIAHELGHLWLGETFLPGDKMRRERRYGSSAPDWLDEVAAILMEDERELPPSEWSID